MNDSSYWNEHFSCSAKWRKGIANGTALLLNIKLIPIRKNSNRLCPRIQWIKKGIRNSLGNIQLFLAYERCRFWKIYGPLRIFNLAAHDFFSTFPHGVQHIIRIRIGGLSLQRIMLFQFRHFSCELQLKDSNGQFKLSTVHFAWEHGG